ncbi:SDR family NAD(P)-dependent oxidoreductase [bacterium]|nr:SDR family NAD(P)-dependent oxidoreductase [bacterium]
MSTLLKTGLGRLVSTVVDPTIFLSFDRAGFHIHSLTFDKTDINVDMTGKVCLITGANSGLGYETALALAKKGATVYMLCRSRDKGERALKGIRQMSSSKKVFLEMVDMSSISSIKNFVAKFSENHVDVLINNAGTFANTLTYTSDNIELTFATNVLGPFLLTELLLPKLMATTASRVINVSSGGLYAQKLVMDALHLKNKKFDGLKAYALSKRALLILTELLAERMAGTGVTANCMHPGWADTPLVRTGLPLFWKILRYDLRTAQEGADTAIWLATCPHIMEETGKFWFDRKIRKTHYLPSTKENEHDRKKLWDMCVKLTGVDDTFLKRR